MGKEQAKTLEYSEEREIDYLLSIPLLWEEKDTSYFHTEGFIIIYFFHSLKITNSHLALIFDLKHKPRLSQLDTENFFLGVPRHHFWKPPTWKQVGKIVLPLETLFVQIFQHAWS